MTKGVLLLAAALFASPASSNTMIYNVNGIQVGPDGKLQRFGGLVIDDQGKVERLFQRTEDLNQPIEREVDGGGRTLLPGLIDAHGHVMGLGLAAIQLDLVGTNSLDDMQERLRGYAAANRNDAWITGRGWNQELWPDKRFPTAVDLDAIVADRPVALERVDGHALVVNSAALKAAGITAATKDPVGGKIERDANGNPTGLLVDAAADLVNSKVPPPSDAQLAQALERAQEILLSSGLTTVSDMGTSEADLRAITRACAVGSSYRIRIISYLTPDFASRLGRRDRDPWFCSDQLRTSGVKLYADGALGSRGAFLKQPYADRPDTLGLRFLTDAELREQAEKAASHGYQLAIHAIGDAANAQVISAYEDLSKQYGRDRRWRIEHFQVADPADIPRLPPAGIIASMQPTHQTSDRLMAEKRLGPDRLEGAYAWQTVLKSGARLAFGSDFPVESPNPFPGLAAAISRQDVNGEPPGGWIPSERLSFEQALHAFTHGAAYAGFAEDRIGALEPGKWADFILVDRDVSTVDPQALARTQVIETWVAGRKVWERTPSAAVERGK